MAINFPTSLDTLPQPTNSTAKNATGYRHGDVHADLALAVMALQAKVGADGSAVASSIDYFMASVRGTGGKPAGAGNFSTLAASGLATFNGSASVTVGTAGAYFNRVSGDNGVTNPSIGLIASGTDVRFYSYGTQMSFRHAAVGGAVSEWLKYSGTTATLTGDLTISAGATISNNSASEVVVGTFQNTGGGAAQVRFANSSRTWALRLASTAFIVYDITGAGPVFSVSPGAASVTGVYQVNGIQVLGARKTGWAAATGTATRTTFDTATVTLAQLAQRVKALLDDFISHGAIGA